MNVPRYPKIQSLWKRDMEAEGHGKGLIMPGEYVMEEFKAIQRWHFTEKIHGQNIRIGYHVQHYDNAPSEYEVEFYGRRGGEGSIQPDLLKRLYEYFTPDLFMCHFDTDFDGEHHEFQVVLYGEGYGDKIQSWHYGLDGEQSFILFDAVINGIWLQQDAVTALAEQLGLERVPILFSGGSEQIGINLCKDGFDSRICPGHPAEGVMARSEPLVLHRYHKTPIQWKLKCKDYDNLRQYHETGYVAKDKFKGF